MTPTMFQPTLARPSRLKMNRREHPRSPLPRTIRGARYDATGRAVCELFEGLDISDGGVGLLARHGFPAGTQITLDLPEKSWVRAKVVSCHRRRAGGVHVGLQFCDDGRSPWACPVPVA
jgi:hypothetical protein